MLIKLRGNHRSSAGDTIVEVLIAIAVASMALVAAYASTAHNNQSIEDTQERSQALQLVQSQIEFLRNNGAAPVGTCFMANGSSGSGANCIVDAAGVPSAAVNAYKITISPPDASRTYTISAVYANAFGNGNSSVSLVYRPENG